LKVVSNFTNLFTEIPANLAEELTQTLLESPPARIERIVSRGHASPKDCWYDQAGNEWVLLVAGAARLEFADRMVELKPGDYLNIPAHEKHRVDWTDPYQVTIWLAVFYG
jgi:cupin 2 domain-containing protein